MPDGPTSKPETPEVQYQDGALLAPSREHDALNSESVGAFTTGQLTSEQPTSGQLTSEALLQPEILQASQIEPDTVANPAASPQAATKTRPETLAQLAKRKVSRRGFIGAGVMVLGVVGVGSGFTLRHFLKPRVARIADKPLLSQTVAFSSLSQRTLAHETTALVDGVRVFADSPVAQQLAVREAQWLDSLAPWTREGEYADAITSAYRDIYVLSEGLAAPVAGWNRLWRYVWPRDSAHIAVASVLGGDMDRALRCFDFLHRLPRTADGWFQARYDLRTLNAPDDREPQFDGLGWVGWSLGLIAVELDQHHLSSATGWDRSSFIERVSPLALSVARSLISNVMAHQGAPVSSDYWEIRETEVTLATAAVTLAGINGLISLFILSGDDTLIFDLQSCADLVVAQIVRDFDVHGYPRHARDDELDCAIPFLLPPYNTSYAYQRNVWEAIAAAKAALRQPAGGLAPGEDWAKDGVSWTPETAIFAMADAFGPTADHAQDARDALQWLADHRTEAGSYSEKVLADGTPVAVAPLAWTAACVAIAAYGLTHGLANGLAPGTTV